MALDLETRSVGDVTLVACRGRLVAGAESESLQEHLAALIPINPHLVLHLGGVEFIDSAGLGLLVRLLTRAKNGHGDLKVCAVSPKVAEVLRVTRLQSIFQAFETEAEAIADAHARDARDRETGFRSANVLCVDTSPDVLAYVRELLKVAGYRAVTAGNLPDALILLEAIRPKVVVISAELRAVTGTRAAHEFHQLAAAGAVVTLPVGFSGRDAASAGGELVAAVRVAMPASV